MRTSAAALSGRKRLEEEFKMVESKDGILDVTTPSAKPVDDEADNLRADNAILRKQVLTYKDTVNILYQALYTTQEALSALSDGIDGLIKAREVR